MGFTLFFTILSLILRWCFNRYHRLFLLLLISLELIKILILLWSTTKVLLLLIKSTTHWIKLSHVHILLRKSALTHHLLLHHWVLLHHHRILLLVHLLLHLHLMIHLVHLLLVNILSLSWKTTLASIELLLWWSKVLLILKLPHILVIHILVIAAI